jgi:hypothetical protein
MKKAVALRPTPSLEDQVSVFMPPSDPVTSPGTGFSFRRLLRLEGLQWKYSNPPPPGELCKSSQIIFPAFLVNTTLFQTNGVGV